MYHPSEKLDQWLLQFRKNIQQEKTILQTLIQWGFANAAFEIHRKIKGEMKELLLQRITSRKNRVAATDEFVLKDRDYTKEDGIMIGVW